MITGIENIKNSRSRFVRISSEDKSTGTNNKFKVDLQSAGGVIDNVKGFIVHSIECPNVFNNVASYNNTLQLYAGAAAYTTTATIPEGNYTIDDLVAQLNIILPPIVAASPLPSVVTVSKVGTYPNEKISFLFAGDDWSIQSASTMLEQIGLGDDDLSGFLGFTCFDGIQTNMPNIPNLIGETAVYVHSRILCANNLSEASGTFSVVDKLNLDQPYGATCYSNFNNDTTHMKSYYPFETKQTLRTVDINLRNREGNLLELPNNFKFTMMIKIFS